MNSQARRFETYGHDSLPSTEIAASGARLFQNVLFEIANWVKGFNPTARIRRDGGAYLELLKEGHVVDAIVERVRRRVLIMALDDNEVLGLSEADLYWRSPRSDSDIPRFVALRKWTMVDSESRRSGVGKMLNDEFLRVLDGWKREFPDKTFEEQAGAHKDNIPSIARLEKLGLVRRANVGEIHYYGKMHEPLRSESHTHV